MVKLEPEVNVKLEPGEQVDLGAPDEPGGGVKNEAEDEWEQGFLPS